MAVFYSYTSETATTLMSEANYEKLPVRSETDPPSRVFQFALPGLEIDLEGMVIGSAELMERLLMGHTIIPVSDEFEGRWYIVHDFEEIMEAFELLTQPEASAKAAQAERTVIWRTYGIERPFEPADSEDVGA